jgi:hypothetical protein
MARFHCVPIVIASTPAGYYVVERARPREDHTMGTNHGAICVFACRGIQTTVVDLPVFKSFQMLPMLVRNGTLTFILLVVFRSRSAAIMEVF